ncbi:MAG TPA: TetR/AcrR family transcriptional regulator [Candidatus Dormibacteraeota bacterium]
MKPPTRRRESSRLAILDAAIALCREEGYGKLSIEGIAARAGAGKHTIYRWWPNKSAVLMDALDREMTANSATFPHTDDFVADMRATIASVSAIQANPDFGPVIAALIAEAQQQPGGGRQLLESFFKPRRVPIVERIRQAQADGELRAAIEPELLLEVIFGALYHRLLLQSGPLDEAYADFVVKLVFSGLITRPDGSPIS